MRLRMANHLGLYFLLFLISIRFGHLAWYFGSSFTLFQTAYDGWMERAAIGPRSHDGYPLSFFSCFPSTFRTLQGSIIVRTANSAERVETKGIDRSRGLLLGGY